jgi:2-dehydropantoate 2-reductase
MTSSLHVGVFGAGAIGGYVGARLAQAGVPVTIVGRGAALEALRHRVRLSDHRGFTAEVAGLRASEDAASLAGASHVLVAVKSGDTEAAARALAGVLPRDAVVLSFQNGVRNAERLRALLPDHLVLAAMVPFNVVRDGARWHQGTSGTLAIEAHPRAAPLREALVRAGLPAVLDHDVARKQWGKLLVNLGNAVNALSGLPIRAMLADRGHRRAMAALFGEGEEALRRAGIRPVLDMPVPAWIVPRLLLLPDGLFRFVLPALAKVDDEARSSMADDLRRGRTTEVEVLNGEIVRLAEASGSAAPRNARIVALVREAERGAPPLSSAELLRALGVPG